ncbi:MAG: hypothetical protein ACPGYV_12250 [Phycisphaeraceae bacterium]
MSDTTKSKQPQPSHELAAQVEELGEHEFALNKNGKRYVFNCAPGNEAQTLNEIAEMVTRADTDLTWFDAAVLSHRLGERMSQRLSDLSARRLSA